ALPVTPAELARTAACLDSGAAMVHLHVLDRDGRHLLDADAYREALAAIRADVADRLLVQITSESFGIYTAQSADGGGQGGAARGRVAGVAGTGARKGRRGGVR